MAELRLLRLHVFTPSGTVVEARVLAVRARDASGAFGIRAGHQPLAALLVPGILAYDAPGAEGPSRLAVDGGLLLCADDEVRVATREAVESDTLEGLGPSVRARFDERRKVERETQRAMAQLEVAILRTLGREALGLSRSRGASRIRGALG